MTATAPRAAARALAVLVVLLGLLAMHGLASTHHAGAAVTQTVAAPHPASPSDHHAVVPGRAPHVVAAEPASPRCDDGCLDLTVLCLAVLTSAVLLALRHTCRRPVPAVLAPSPGVRVTGPAPARHARGPDPVRELCVSRT